ncbi:MAG: cupin-like domain-containing protein [Hyphomicrobiaceae bacterium]|nr:cupin-like domain-containing protein [Hyphomicrobiaceae bacterium]
MRKSATSTANTLAFEPGHDTSFGSGLSHFRHGFNESGLFTDKKLAELIDSYPREYYMITTMSGAGERPEWRNGDFNGASGKFVLNAIRSGQLWLCLRRLDLVAPEIDTLVNDAFGEIEARNPELKTSRRRSSLLISSPGARVLYHSDIPMVALWHVRGRKRVWLYDADNPVHLPDETLEGVVLRETEEEIFYDPAWDAEAAAIDLEPGWALSWPQNAPHRVDNLDGLNVSITTDYYTPAAQRKYGVYYTNGLMRRRFGWDPKSTATEGARALAKCMAAVAMKKLGVHSQAERDMMQSFVLDLSKPGAIDELPQNEWRPILQV